MNGSAHARTREPEPAPLTECPPFVICPANAGFAWIRAASTDILSGVCLRAKLVNLQLTLPSDQSVESGIRKNGWSLPGPAMNSTSMVGSPGRSKRPDRLWLAAETSPESEKSINAGRD